jgi:hypothetical protein
MVVIVVKTPPTDFLEKLSQSLSHRYSFFKKTPIAKNEKKG